MNAHVYIPENELRDSIDCIWYHAEDQFNYRSVSIPFLHPELIFNLGDSFCVEAEGISYNYTITGALSGIYLRPLTTVVRGRYKAMGVIFKPEGLHRLFGVPAWRYDKPVSLPEIVGLDGVIDALLEEPEPAKKVACLEEFLLQKARPARTASVVEDFLETVRAEPLRKGRIREYVKDTGRTAKQLIQAFKNSVGHAPQTYLQLLQVNNAVAAIASHPERSLTGIAYEQGFYDQAHFIRVFQKFAGITPMRYKRLAAARQIQTGFPNTILCEGNPVQFF